METAEKYEVCYIRHAQSFFNMFIALQRTKSPAELGATPSEISELSQVADKFDPKLADPRLTSKGVAQCEAAKSQYHAMPIKVVFVSPLKRAMETAELLFRGHPMAESIKFVVHPLLSEMLAGSNEIPCPVSEKIREFGPRGFDFGLFSGYKRPELYFVCNINSPEREELLKKIEENEPKVSYIETVCAATKIRRTTYPTHDRKVENYMNLRKRAKEFALFVKDYMAKNGLKSGEVAVVAHSTFIGQTTATEFNSYHKGVFTSMENCGYRMFDVNSLSAAKF